VQDRKEAQAVLDHLGLLDHLVRVHFGRDHLVRVHFGRDRDHLLDMPAQVSLCVSLSLSLYLSPSIFLFLSLPFSPWHVGVMEWFGDCLADSL